MKLLACELSTNRNYFPEISDLLPLLKNRAIELNPPKCLDMPIIDFSGSAYDLHNHQRLVNEIMEACKYGMFQIKNHPVCNSVLVKAIGATNRFFNLPCEELEKLPKLVHGSRYLYSGTWASSKMRTNWRDVLKLDLNSAERRHCWPTNPHNFKDDIWQFSTDVEKVQDRLKIYICDGLGLNLNYFERGLSDEDSLCMSWYPPCQNPTLIYGLPPHADPGLFSISYQGEVAGQQIYQNDQWKQVTPSANVLLVTLGRQLEVISNGRIKAAEQRVVVNSERAVTHLSYWTAPNGQCMVGPAKKLITESNPPRYKTYKFDTYFSDHVNEWGDTDTLLKKYMLENTVTTL